MTSSESQAGERLALEEAAASIARETSEHSIGMVAGNRLCMLTGARLASLLRRDATGFIPRVTTDSGDGDASSSRHAAELAAGGIGVKSHCAVFRVNDNWALLVAKDSVEPPFSDAELSFARRMAPFVDAALSTAELINNLEALVALEMTRVVEREAGLQKALDALGKEMTTRLKMEAELRHAQKLESIGRLAAGVAHEINTPVQFVGDSINFVRDGAKELFTLIERHGALRRAIRAGEPFEPVLAAVDAAEEEADLSYLVENVPVALERALDGLDRVATIVQSMKAFAYPDSTEPSFINIAESVQSTLTVARNEYKYVADLKTEFCELPEVLCYPGELNQAVLNVVVNAAHAIEEALSGTSERGLLTVRTVRDGDSVVISIQDTGGGIPEAVRGSVFDPFFTTKRVGKGTGQGLAIARSVVVEKHGGTITFETELGRGTTFFLRIPLKVAVAELRGNEG
ncbi:MAG: ATP-binding protein [Myxococcus sp.]|nr:ATP-binding protein [Myxococcus sp.]